MKRIFIFVFALLISLSISAQGNTIRLTVIGEGATKEEATANALRSAIEQAFGTFVSANTQILNDDIVKDEIATISSGNIQEYTELGCITMPDGSKSVSLSATVSIGNLISYAKSKGSTTEFAGAVFVMNMKMRKLNAENETRALFNMLDQLYELAPYVFDWRLEARDPIVASAQQYKIPFTVKSIVNEASQAFYSILINTFQSLSLSPIEVDEYNINGMTVYPVEIEGKKYFLRNSPSEILALIQYLIYCINKSYNIKACLNGADDTSVNLEYINNEDLRYRDDRILLFRNGKTDESYTVMSEELLNTLQGFDITHTPITQFEFQNQNNTIIATRLTVYQPLDIPGQIDVKGLKYLKIKDGLKKIKISQFSHSNNLTDVHIGDCVKHIEAYSFSSCKSLRKVVIGNGVTSIGENAFNGCKNLDTVILGDSVTFISDHAFAFCNILKIRLPRGIDYIGTSAFYGNKNLEEIHLSSIVPPEFGNYPFGELYTHNTTFKIFVPKQSVERYKNLYNWGSYSSHIIGHDYDSSLSNEEIQTTFSLIKPFLTPMSNATKIVFNIAQYCSFSNYTQKWSDWQRMNSTIEIDFKSSTLIVNPIDFGEGTDKSLLITDISEWETDNDGDKNLNLVCYKGDTKFNVKLTICEDGQRRIYVSPVGYQYNSFCYSIINESPNAEGRDKDCNRITEMSSNDLIDISSLSNFFITPLEQFYGSVTTKNVTYYDENTKQWSQFKDYKTDINIDYQNNSIKLSGAHDKTYQITYCPNSWSVRETNQGTYQSIIIECASSTGESVRIRFEKPQKAGYNRQMYIDSSNGASMCFNVSGGGRSILKHGYRIHPASDSNYMFYESVNEDERLYGLVKCSGEMPICITGLFNNFYWKSPKYTNNLVIAEKGGKWGAIDFMDITNPDGVYCIPFVYDSIEPFNGGKSNAVLNGNKTVVLATDKVFIPFNDFIDNNNIVDSIGETILKDGHHIISGNAGQYIAFEYKGKIGFAQNSSDAYISFYPQYDKINLEDKYVILVSKDGKWGTIPKWLDERCDEIPCIYDKVAPFNNGMSEVVLKGDTFTINMKGERIQ